MSDIFDHEADAWGSLECGPDDGEPWRSAAGPSCRHCRARGLWWRSTACGRWQLMEGPAAHQCAQKTANDFEDLDQ